MPYLLHRPWHSFFGKLGLLLPFNGENFSDPLYSINLIKGFYWAYPRLLCHQDRKLQLRKCLGVCKNRMAINYGSEGTHTCIHSSVKWRQGLKGIIQNTQIPIQSRNDDYGPPPFVSQTEVEVDGTFPNLPFCNSRYTASRMASGGISLGWINEAALLKKKRVERKSA